MVANIGPITIDYMKLTVDFLKNGYMVTLIGAQSIMASQLTHHPLRHLFQTNLVASFFFHLIAQMIKLNTSSEVTANNIDIEQVFDRCLWVFEAPSSLPPPRQIQHLIRYF